MDKQSIILFSQGEIQDWKGLPEDLVIQDLEEIFGAPSEKVEYTLGYYPSNKYDFCIDDEDRRFIAFERDEKIIMIETNKLPESGVLKILPEPDAILKHEIILDDAYAAEYIYCERGLDLTVAKHFDDSIADKIVRCRGFEKISKPDEFDTRYYRSFENSRQWSS